MSMSSGERYGKDIMLRRVEGVGKNERRWDWKGEKMELERREDGIGRID
jgi:hypothetical protein